MPLFKLRILLVVVVVGSHCATTTTTKEAFCLPFLHDNSNAHLQGGLFRSNEVLQVGMY